MNFLLPGLFEKGDNFCMTFLAGDVKRVPTQPVRTVRIRSVLEEETHDGKVTVPGCLVQRGVTKHARLIHIGPLLQQPPHNTETALLTRGV